MRICARCILDETVPTIKFDSNGVCNFCSSHDVLDSLFPLNSETANVLERAVEKIKKAGKNADYDCIVGVSGGTDSSYVLSLAKKLGLRPVAVHFDNGWNSDQAVTNIKSLTDKLKVDLVTYVVDWEEFKSLQVAFLKASVPCIEAPTDVGIHGTLFRMADKFNIKYILGGQSFRTEGTVPRIWSYLDGLYISDINKKFGTVKLKSFPNLFLNDIGFYTFFKRIRQFPILNYIQYDKATAKKELALEFGFVDYDGHHYENLYSKFAFGWYLPNKFGIDKRKVSLSGPVRSGLISREEALKKLQTKPLITDELVEYTINKLGIDKATFDRIMKLENKTYLDYKNSEVFLHKFSFPVKIATNLGLLTPVLYEKYFKN